jgi:hypothetical protein
MSVKLAKRSRACVASTAACSSVLATFEQIGLIAPLKTQLWLRHVHVGRKRNNSNMPYRTSSQRHNQYGASGNRVGLIFNFDPEVGDYSEVVFAPTGQAYLNNFVQGHWTQVATGTQCDGEGQQPQSAIR